MALTLNDQYQNIQNSLKKSPTAYGYGTPPTLSDERQQIQLMNIQKQMDTAAGKAKSTALYGAPTQPTPPPQLQKQGVVGTALHTLAAPLYGVVGAAQHFLGKGTEPGLLANMGANVKQGNTFGDLLRSEGAPNIIAMPLGFALDVAMDPVNWATMGADALVPRTAMGLAKGAGLEGLTSGLAEKAATVADRLPIVSRLLKKIPGYAENVVNPIKNYAEASSNAFREATGTAVEDVLKRPYQTPIQSVMKKFTGEPNLADAMVKSPAGSSLVKAFQYSDTKFNQTLKDIDTIQNQTNTLYKTSNLSDVVKHVQEAGAGLASKIDPATMTMDDMSSLSQLNEVMKTPFSKQVADAMKADPNAEPWTVLKNKLSDYQMLMANIAPKVFNDKELGTALAAEKPITDLLKTTIQEMDKIQMERSKTGVSWFDTLSQAFNNWKVGDVPVGNKIANGYQTYLSMFKASKIGASPVAYTNSAIGNLVMGHMMGLNMWEPKYWRMIGEAFNYARGKGNPMFLAQVANDPAWKEFISKYPTLFESVYGLRGGKVLQESDNLMNMIRDIYKNDPKASVDSADYDELTKLIGQWQGTAKIGTAEALGREGKNVIAATGETGAPSTFYQSDIENSQFRQIVDKVAAKAADPASSSLWKIANKFLSGTQAYSKIDQAYKLGTAVTMANVGLSERELMMVRRFVDLTGPGDVIKGAGGLWKLSPEKATEVASEAYMNYGAMPSAVKMLRQLPVAGSPFLSFTYAMLNKMSRTAIRNPEMFNRVQFALKEMQGERSPLEKNAIEHSPYYQFMNQPGYVKIPFFQKNPVYINMGNMLPYYTLMMLNPAERNYTDSNAGAIMATFDHMPFFKTPEGQTLIDYFIQPLIVRDTNPVGMFDQPLYPSDAPAWAKYGALPLRNSLGEAMTPGIASYLGLTVPAKYAEWLPSYGMRKMSNAKAGNTALGIPTKTNPFQKAGQAAIGLAGVPNYQIQLPTTTNNLTNNPNQ